MNYFNKNLGQEIFMLVEKRKLTRITFFKKADEILLHFNINAIGNVHDTDLYHGILTKAISIPKSIYNNIDMLVIVKDTNNYNIFSCADMQYVQKLISLLVGVENIPKDVDYSIISKEIQHLPKQSIDNIYILYGYAIELHYHFNKNELDEEIISGSKEIYADICSKQ